MSYSKLSDSQLLGLIEENPNGEKSKIAQSILLIRNNRELRKQNRRMVWLTFIIALASLISTIIAVINK